MYKVEVMRHDTEMRTVTSFATLSEASRNWRTVNRQARKGWIHNGRPIEVFLRGPKSCPIHWSSYASAPN